MQIISCAKNLILSDFENLETKFTYQKNPDGEISDFQFFGLRRFFVSVNKRFSIEILRAENETIHRIKKIKVENIYCASSPNQNDDEIALGLTSGEIKFFNYRNREYGQHFPPDSTRSSVLFLDYNATDDYLSSVYENGHINIFGIKTKQKMETLKFDETCTLSKFHPIKRFHLGVATQRGAIYMYDTSTKRDIFHSIDAHKSPCRDVAMSAGCSDLLISVGFDCIVNIFDIRRRNKTIQIDGECPLSSVAVSECGKYFCVGNLKGELMSYDMRNTKNCLKSKKMHDKSISRIAFVPDQKMNEMIRKSMGIMGSCSTSSTSSSISSIVNQQQQQQQQQQLQEQKDTVMDKSGKRRDSFFDFIDNFTSISHNNKTTGGYRFSFGLNNLSSDIEKKTTDIFSPSGSDNLNELRYTDLISEQMKIPEENEEIDESLVFVSPDIKHKNEFEQNKQEQQQQPLQQKQILLNKTPIVISSCENSKIQNENSDHDSEIENDVVDDNENEENLIYLENKLKINHRNILDTSNLFTKDIEEFPKLPDYKNSTPNSNQRKTSIPIIKKEEVNSSSKKLSDTSIQAVIEPIEVNYQNQLQNLCTDIKMEIQNLRTEMNDKFNKLENELKYNAEENKWQIINQSIHLYQKQHEVNENVEEALFYLIKTDEFLNDYLRLKKENRELKNKLNRK